MAEKIYEISKVRFSEGEKGWGIWRYEVKLTNLKGSSRLNLQNNVPKSTTITTKGGSTYFQSIDSIAADLATLPDIAASGFVPGISERPLVLLHNGVLTQWGRVSDEELGELGTLIREYINIKERR